MKTLTRNTTQPRSNTMRLIANNYRPSKGMKWSVRLHNATYHIQRNANVILAGIVILAVLVFVDLAAPALVNNIIHDILAKR